jgi:DNA repair protein RadC
MKSIDILKCKLVKDTEIKYSPVTMPNEAVDIFRAFGMADSADEIFAIACLSMDGSIAGVHEISHGDLSSSLVHPREVFKRAILNNAATIILCHNHPSGSLKPSLDDRSITNRLKSAGDLLGISVIDHIIISESDYISFKSEGLI